MAYAYKTTYRSGGGGPINFFGPLSLTVKYLIIANATVFGVTTLAAVWWHRGHGMGSMDPVSGLLALYPLKVFPGAQAWRLGTYLFTHEGLSHILMNMLALWWFGSPLEMIWGRRKFLTYYLVCGIGAGLVCVPYYILLGQGQVPIVGASGAIFGLLAAFALVYPNSLIYVWFVIPIKAKWLVLILMAVEFMTTVQSGGGSGVANIAHLSGGLIGYFYLRRLMDLKYYYLRFRTRKTRRPLRVVPREDDEDKEQRGPWLH
jgi:membrane associated rhomboid family serine protease